MKIPRVCSNVIWNSVRKEQLLLIIDNAINNKMNLRLDLIIDLCYKKGFFAVF
jgi:hypothetical protein